MPKIKKKIIGVKNLLSKNKLKGNQPPAQIGSNWGIKALGIDLLWGETTGKGVKVAILDTGIDKNHPDLTLPLRNCICEDFSPDEDIWDAQHHGTHVAGIVAGTNKNISVAPESDLIIAKVIYNLHRMTNDEWIESGIKWAVRKGTNVINMSFGTKEKLPKTHQAIKDAIDSGVFVICAAGDSKYRKEGILYPAKYPETIAVGGTTQKKELASFSPIGKEITVVAPGSSIYSTIPLPRKYGIRRGTSFAAPFLSGVVALMLAKQKKTGINLINDQKDLFEKLKKTSTKIDDKDPQKYGWGLINPTELLK